MAILMTWHQPRPHSAALWAHLKKNQTVLRKAAALSLLVAALVGTSPTPLWIALPVWGVVSLAAFALALIPENWPAWLTAPIPIEKVQAMGRSVAHEIALEILDAQGGRRVPPNVTLFFVIRSERIMVRLKGLPPSIDADAYQRQADVAFEKYLKAYSRLKRMATAAVMEDGSGDLRVISVPIPQPSNHEILARQSRPSPRPTAP